MYTMQSFYTSLFAPSRESALDGFLRIARAKLQEILAVRSELAWEVWTESK
jgi:hypothetical protein